MLSLLSPLGWLEATGVYDGLLWMGGSGGAWEESRAGVRGRKRRRATPPRLLFLLGGDGGGGARPAGGARRPAIRRGGLAALGTRPRPRPLAHRSPRTPPRSASQTERSGTGGVAGVGGREGGREHREPALGGSMLKVTARVQPETPGRPPHTRRPTRRRPTSGQMSSCSLTGSRKAATTESTL